PGADRLRFGTPSRWGRMTVMERRRAVVTGVGVVASPGVGREMFWKGLSEFPGAGPHEVRNWDPEPAIPRREARRLDRFAQFAVIAAQDALSQAGELDVDPNRDTVNVASGIGGLETLEVLIGNAYHAEPRVSPLWIPMMMCNAAAAAISIRSGFGGPASPPVAACRPGARAVRAGLRQGDAAYARA